MVDEDFKKGFVSLNQQDSSIKSVISTVEKLTTNPALQGKEYSVQSVEGKDFLFGRLFVIKVSLDSATYSAFVYHDQSSE